MKYYIVLLGFAAASVAQQYTTPVPILKQINKHNEDGSYSYGYEAADGTYKIESKYPNGEVFGKYGYLDDRGALREIEYGASRRGFEPQGNDINVAPPTLTNNYPPKPLGPNEEDDGQYREDPSVYYKNEKYNQNPAPVYQPSSKYSFDSHKPKYTQPIYQKPAYQPEPVYQPEPAYQPEPHYQQQPSYNRQPSYQQSSYEPPSYQQPAYTPSTKFSFDDFISNRPQPTPSPQHNYYNPPPQPSYTQNYGQQHSGHPATNVDLNLGSYSVNYKRR